MATTETFSESWHRVAGLRLALRPSVDSRRVWFRGERWHVLSDPYSNQFFRIRPAAWDFVARLDGRRTVARAWEECLAHHPESAPGQQDVIQLLGQLHHANLLRSDASPDSLRILERHRKRRHRELRSRFSSILFLRIPLFDPDQLLRRTLPAVSWMFSRWGALLWLAVVVLAGKLVFDRWDEARDSSAGVLAPGNLPLLYLGMAGIKLLHELGHGYACRRLGGEVHTLGVMLLIFTPMPFVDATSSWNFPRRRDRILVGAAGMIVEWFVAALAVFVWAGTGPGVVHSLAYNMMFVASVSTLLFNANPLLRFDGYYILSDLIGMPNLHQRARQWWRHAWERRVFGNRRSESPAESLGEASFLAGFGAAAFVYRIILFAGILLFVAGQFLLLGMIMAIAGIITWVILPLGKFVRYLATSPRLERCRPRAVASVAALTALILILLAVLPFPRSFRAPGVVRSENYTAVLLDTPGLLQQLTAISGSSVEAGQTLARLSSPELDWTMSAAVASLEEARAMEHTILSKDGVGLAAARERIRVAEEYLRSLEEKQARLEVRAPFSGIWVAPWTGQHVGRWLPQGFPLGELIDPSGLLFAAAVSQEDAAWLYGDAIRSVSVRVSGQSEHRLAVESRLALEADRRTLPSAALGWMAGGGIALAPGDQSGRAAAESFFEIRARLLPTDEVALIHGRSGALRCALTWEPLLPRLHRSLRQLIQRRFST